MKATCIVGSARSDGSTSYIIDTLMKGMNESGIKAIKYCLSEMKINYCLGCKKCYFDGRCIQNDDVERIVRDVLNSDIVVIATPSYWADVPGQLKTYFDRNTPYGDTNDSRVIKANKKIRGIGIAVRTGKTERENTAILDFIDHYFGHLGIEPIERISICQNSTLEDLKQKHQQELDYIYQLGKRL